MTAQRRCRKKISRAGGQAITIRWLAALAGLITATALSAVPAHADTTGDTFLKALSNAGVPYGDPQRATSLGESICPMLARPGADLAAVAARVRNDGMSPEMARLFTGIAITLYCPRMMASFANGDLPSFPQIPGI